MTDTLARLAGPVALGAAAATIYTAPASTVVVVRSVRVCNESATQRTFRLSVGADGAGTRFFYDVPVDPTDEGFDWNGSLILAAGEVLQAYASAASALTISISGVKVT